MQRSLSRCCNASIRRNFFQAARFCSAGMKKSDVEIKSQRIITQVEHIYDTALEPMDEYNLVPKERTTLPLVLLLGNHSSGKSTFINYLLHQKEQATGVAPTDDGFTIICHSDIDADEDGPTVVGDPQWGFSELKNFPKAFVNHLKLKQRVLQDDALLPEGLMIVDSPGMIDTASKSEQHIESRGYNFLEVVKWFAERADVVLLLFDPDKPGTTGETLQVLTESLVDLDHKVLLVMNKVDQFERVHDFARAYGSLCWNLAKVIHRKDLPRIFTMFTPTDPEARGQQLNSRRRTTETTLSPADSRVSITSDKDHDRYAQSHIPLMDFNQTRDEVIHEIVGAPHKRVDNVVTQLEESINKLMLSTEMHNAVVKHYNRYQRTHLLNGALTIGSTATMFIATAWAAMPWYIIVAASSGVGLPTGMAYYQSLQNINNIKSVVISSLDKIFSERFAVDLMSDGGDLRARWQRLKPMFQARLREMDLKDLRTIKALASLKKNKDKWLKDLRLQCNEVRNLIAPRRAAPLNNEEEEEEEEPSAESR